MRTIYFSPQPGNSQGLTEDGKATSERSCCRFPAADSRERQVNGDAVLDLPCCIDFEAGDPGAGSDPSFQPSPDWVGSRAAGKWTGLTGSDTQKVARDGKVTGRVGGAGPHGDLPLCRLGFHAERVLP